MGYWSDHPMHGDAPCEYKALLETLVIKLSENRIPKDRYNYYLIFIIIVMIIGRI